VLVYVADEHPATHAGIATIVRVERNQVEPRGSTIRKLAEALGVEPEELVKMSKE
jgi:transcriptional regulator with XRE-family HTH domain